MTRALEMLRDDPSDEFEAAFCRATGVFDEEARRVPAKTYTTAEIQELFAYLFDLRTKRKSP